MKTIYEEFNCPQYGGLRYINVDGICFDSKNKNTLETLMEQRKLEQKLENFIQSLSIDV